MLVIQVPELDIHNWSYCVCEREPTLISPVVFIYITPINFERDAENKGRVNSCIGAYSLDKVPKTVPFDIEDVVRSANVKNTVLPFLNTFPKLYVRFELEKVAEFVVFKSFKEEFN